MLAAQPFSVLVDARLDAFRPGYAELSVPLRPDLRQQYGYAHGGVLSFLADNALTFAGGSMLGVRVITAGFTIDYLRPAVGVRLTARGRVVSAGRRLATTRAEIYSLAEDGTETECAAAQGRIVTVSDHAEDDGAKR